MDPSLPGSGTLSTAALAFSVLLKLGVVVGLIYVSLHLLRRWQVVRPAGLPKQLAVLETQRLSPRQALHLVRVGSQVVLVGATDSALTLLSASVELAEAPLSEAAAGEADTVLAAPAPIAAVTALPGFNHLLQKAMQVVRPKLES